MVADQSVSMSECPLHVVLISSSDPLDVHSFSGSIFYMAKALQAEFPQIEIVRASRAFWFEPLQRVLLKLSKGRIDPYYWRPLNRLFAARLAKRWRNKRVVVIAVVNSALVGQLAARVPVINVSDSTYDLMRTEHEVFWSLGSGAAARAEEDEANSIRRSVHSSFSSHWAANSAIQHYGASPDDVSVISWGCNFETVPASEVREEPFAQEECRLMFIGGEWERKGGDIVCEAARLLSAKGMKVRVDAVGAPPPDGQVFPAEFQYHGYLSKADPEHAMRLRGLMRDAELLFLPTRRDCTPMVFAEANAYGTPALTRGVGGVADVVHDGANGIVLPEHASTADFASAIETLWKGRSRYAALRRSARAEYDNRLNWSVWARGIGDQVRRLAAEGRI